MSKKTILLLTDFSNLSMRAADIALELAVNNQADLLIYNSIISNLGDEISLMINKSQEKLDELAEQLRGRLISSKQHTTTIVVRQGMGLPVETILNLTSENNFWMVVMGTHIIRNMGNQFLDSNVPSVLNNCGCPLLLVP